MILGQFAETAYRVRAAMYLATTTVAGVRLVKEMKCCVLCHLSGSPSPGETMCSALPPDG